MKDSKLVEYSQLVERNETYYLINSETPFSGTAVSYHPNGQIKSEVNFKDGVIVE